MISSYIFFLLSISCRLREENASIPLWAEQTIFNVSSFLNSIEVQTPVNNQATRAEKKREETSRRETEPKWNAKIKMCCCNVLCVYGVA